MKISLLNIRKKRGRKTGSPLKSDPALLNLLSRLSTVNDFDSYEPWKRQFKERMGYFLIDEGIEKAEEAYHVRLRVKVDKLVRVISNIAHQINQGSLSPTNVTIQAQNSLDEGMKSCEDISTYLKVLSPMNSVEEKIVGFTKYNTASLLVETDFNEYERLNMCRDILQVLRENFVNPVAGPKHIVAFDKYEKEILSFKTILLDDVGLLPVFKKQRQLKTPIPPKALIKEIRRGVLREALVSKSPLLANRSRDPANEANKTKRSRKKSSSKSPLQRRPKSKSPKVHIKRSVDNLRETNRNPSKPRRKKKSKSPKRKTDHGEKSKSNREEKSKSNRPSSRGRGTRNITSGEDGNGEGISRSVQKTSIHNRSAHLNETNKSKPQVSRDTIPVDVSQTPPDPQFIMRGATYSTTASHPKSDTLVNFPKSIFPSTRTHLSEDEKSMSSVQRKNMSRLKATKARKGRPLLKNTTRERNKLTAMRGQKALHRKEFSVNTLSDHNGETNSDGYTFQTLKQEDASKDTLPRSSRVKTTLRNEHRQNGSKETGSQERIASKRCDSFELIKYVKPVKENSRRQLDAPTHGRENNRKKKLGSKSSKRKKKLLKTDDYKKIIHGKAYPASAKMELPKLTTTSRFPVLVSESKLSKEAHSATENNTIRPRFEKPQAKMEENLSSVFLSSLLGSFDSPRREQDESSDTIPQRTPYENISLFQPNNSKLQLNRPLLGHMDGKSASTSSNPINAPKTWGAMKSNGKSYLEKTSFYEKFVEPLTNTEHDPKGNGNGEWAIGRDIFEDSVCSSRYVSSQKSMDEAISKFNSDEAIIELQRLNETKNGKHEESEIQKGDPKRQLSSPTLTRMKNKLEEKGISKAAKLIEREKVAKPTGKKMNFDEKQNLFEDTGEYSPRHQAKVLTAEEEAVRMADEVAKLQIALEDNQHVLFCTEEQEEIDIESQSCWKFKEESEDLLAENMLKLKVGDDRILLRWKSHNDEERGGERISNEDTTDLDDEEDYYREVELKMTKKDSCHHDTEEEKYRVKGDELNIAANILKLHSSTDDVLNIDDDNDDCKKKHEVMAMNEYEPEATDKDISQLREVSEALDMVEKMLLLESNKKLVQKEDLVPSGRFRDSDFHIGGKSPVMTAGVPIKKDIHKTSAEPEINGAFAFDSKHRRHSEQPNPVVLGKAAKKSEYPGFFSLQSNESLSTRYFDRNTNNKKSLTLATPKHKSKYAMGHSSRTQYSNTSSFRGTIMKDDKMMAPSKGVRRVL